jgi:hypothetical protein
MHLRTAGRGVSAVADLPDHPGVAAGIGEPGVGLAVIAFGVRPVDPAVRLHVADRLDFDTASGELGDRLLDVGHHQMCPLIVPGGPVPRPTPMLIEHADPGG